MRVPRDIEQKAKLYHAVLDACTALDIDTEKTSIGDFLDHIGIEITQSVVALYSEGS